MTREETKKAIEVMQGYVDGKDIESRIKGHADWFPRNCPDWDFGTCDYRIKPEPHYRPFESAEEVMEAIKEHGDWVVAIANVQWRHRIISYSCQRVITGYNYDDHSDGELLSQAFKRYAFVDGTTFGKLVEE